MKPWGFIAILSLLLIPVFAITQSHPLSQIGPIDSNLNLGTYELFANVYHVGGQRAWEVDSSTMRIGDLAGGDGLRHLELWAGDGSRLQISTSGTIDARGNKITGVATPSAGSNDVATASWVEAQIGAAATPSTPGVWSCTVRTGQSSSGGGYKNANANCIDSEKVITGGCDDALDGVDSRLTVMASHPTSSPQGWYCESYADISHTLHAFAQCCA